MDRIYGNSALIEGSTSVLRLSLQNHKGVLTVMLHNVENVSKRITLALLSCEFKVAGKQTIPYMTFDVIFTILSISSHFTITSDDKDAAMGIEIAQAADDNVSSISSWISLRGNMPSKPLKFLENVFKAMIKAYDFNPTAIAVFVPGKDGYIVRSDVVERRFLTCALVEETADFTQPRQKVHAPLGRAATVLSMFKEAIGAILLKRCLGMNAESVILLLGQLQSEVTARLSFPWIVDAPLPTKRLAVIEGRPSPSESDASEGPYRAAKALGIDVVVLDQEGHWLQGEHFAHLRDEFIVCDLTIDGNLPSRIIESLAKSKGHIDGIITYSDKLLVTTAKVAHSLNLPASSVDAIEGCSDKAKMREIITPDLVLSVTDVEDLKSKFKDLKAPLQYPLIVKPTRGQASEGVHIAHSEKDLVTAVERDCTAFPGKRYLVEPYVSGPEVDANLVLLDGEIVFDEINDDFPSPAELPGASSSSFAETSTIMPSLLPHSELLLLRSALLKSLLKIGLKSGVFHIEARVENSTMRYEYRDEELELREVSSGTHSSRVSGPSVFLIEINARTPGHQPAFAAEFTYGVDYYALYTLLALLPHSSISCLSGKNEAQSELQILQALTSPFPTHIQYPTHLVWVPVTRGGKFIRSKPLPQKLMNHVLKFRILLKEGDIIEDPATTGKWPFMAYFLVVARVVGMEGRMQVRILGEAVRSAFEVEII
jgi:biotin carboxylase